MNILSYKGYSSRIDFDAEDKILHGRISSISSNSSAAGAPIERKCRVTAPSEWTIGAQWRRWKALRALAKGA